MRNENDFFREAAKALNRAANILEERKLVKDKLFETPEHDGESITGLVQIMPKTESVTGCCLTGALRLAVAERDARDLLDNPAAWSPVRRGIYFAALHPLLKFTLEAGYDGPGDWNDDPARTREEVLALLRNAAKTVDPEK